ncbi:MAG TPA: acetolactate synthase large subunit, partial [Deltaproteobacteria bacterium]|nr:acetolactate synthase large subunit [Deltaproteobacteria bacterium]
GVSVGESLSLLPLVEALDSVAGMRAVLGLFEGVCTGAADGYGRMAGRPAMTLLHLGPGCANGIANLHNARRAHTPVLNIIGDHATWHRQADPPLAMDIPALAGTVSRWCRASTSADDLARDTCAAVAAARQGGVATLIVPQDHQWEPVLNQADAVAAPTPITIDARAIEEAARLLNGPGMTALLLGGRALSAEGLRLSARIRAATGCDLLAETFPGRIERGAGLPDVQRIPYLPEMAIPMLARYANFVIAGAKEPIAFFGYQGTTGRLLSDSQRCLTLGADPQSLEAALAALADTLGAPNGIPEAVLAPAKRPDLPSGPLHGAAVCEVLACLQPADAIVVEEAVTSSLAYYPATAGVPPFSLLTLTGGSLGQGMPCAVGAALACPDRTVIDFQADGSSLYTPQALWTQARERLNITTIICSNRSYDILKLEMARAGTLNPGTNARRLTDLSGVDWVKFAEGLGVPACQASTCEELARALATALASPGPHLIEAIM